MTQELNMIQVVGVKTRGEEILDLMFMNNSDVVHNVSSYSWESFTDENIC